MMKKKGMAKGGYRGGVKKMKKGGVALKGYSPIVIKPQRFQGVF